MLVGVVTRLQAGESGFRLPTGVNFFSHLQSVQTSAKAPAATYLVDKASTTIRMWSWPLIAKVKNMWSIISIPPYVASQRDFFINRYVSRIFWRINVLSLLIMQLLFLRHWTRNYFFKSIRKNKYSILVNRTLLYHNIYKKKYYLSCFNTKDSLQHHKLWFTNGFAIHM